MPAKRCPACGYRNSQAISTCINCGEALGLGEGEPAEVEPVPEAQAEAAAPPAEVVASQPARPGTVPNVTERLPQERERDALPPATEEKPRSPGLPRPPVAEKVARSPGLLKPPGWGYDASPSAAVDKRRLPVPIMDTGLSPYQTALKELAPFQGFQGIITPNAGQSVGDEDREPLPFGFALTKPRLYGTIVSLDVREQLNDFPNIGKAILAIFSEVFWSILNVQTTREAAERNEVTKLRIQASDGRAHDAILQGVQRGANLSMGDTVSLWGHRRRGNLVIHKGYDHTTRSKISSTGRSAFWPALLIVLLIGVLYLASLPQFWPHVFNIIKEVPGWFKKL